MQKDTSVEDVTTWLARETGHAPEADEGYEVDGEEPASSFGLPNPKHEKMRRFFDGLQVEKQLKAKRDEEALSMVDEAEEMNNALKGAIKPTGGY